MLLNTPTKVNCAVHLNATRNIAVLTMSQVTCTAMKEDESTSTLTGTALIKHCELQLRTFFEPRIMVLAQCDTRASIPDMDNLSVSHTGNYMIYHIPILPTTGSNQELAYKTDAIEYVGLSDKVGTPLLHREIIGRYLHGTYAERVFGILQEGGMRPSTENIRRNITGVYARSPDDWLTPLSYAIGTPLGNDGIYYSFMLELRAHTDHVKQCGAKLGKDKVLNPKKTRVMALRVYVKKARYLAVGDGSVIRQAWDPFLELHLPTRALPITAVTEEDQTSESLLSEVQSLQLDLKMPVLDDTTNADGSFPAKLLEFEALRDDSGVVPVNTPLLEELMKRIVENPTKPWHHCHNAVALLCVIHRLEALQEMEVPGNGLAMRVRRAMYYQTKGQTYDRRLDPARAGYDPRQEFVPVSSTWVKDRFGLYIVYDKEATVKAEEPQTTKNSRMAQLSQRTKNVGSSDPINFWVGNRIAAPADDGHWLRENSTAFCYFKPFKERLDTCGAERGDSSRVAELFVRT